MSRLRFHFRPDGKKIDGIRYPTARYSDGSSVAFFCRRANLVLSSEARREIRHDEIGLAGEEPWLKLIRSSYPAVEMLPSFTAVQSIASKKRPQ